MALTGEFADVPIADLFTLIGQKEHSGLLSIQLANLKYQFFLKQGKIIAYTQNDLLPLPSQYLHLENKEQKKKVERFIITKLKDTIAEMFFWEQGNFVLNRSNTQKEPYQLPPQDPQKVISYTHKTINDWRQTNRFAPPPKSNIIIKKESAKVHISEYERYLLEKIKPSTSPEHLIGLIAFDGISKLEVYTILHRWKNYNLIAFQSKASQSTTNFKISEILDRKSSQNLTEDKQQFTASASGFPSKSEQQTVLQYVDLYISSDEVAKLIAVFKRSLTFLRSKHKPEIENAQHFLGRLFQALHQRGLKDLLSSFTGLLVKEILPDPSSENEFAFEHLEIQALWLNHLNLSQCSYSFSTHIWQRIQQSADYQALSNYVRILSIMIQLRTDVEWDAFYEDMLNDISEAIKQRDEDFDITKKVLFIGLLSQMLAKNIKPGLVLRILTSVLKEQEMVDIVTSVLVESGGERAIKQLLGMLKNNREKDLRLLIVDILKKFGHDGVKLVLDELAHKLWYVRRNACSILGEIGEQKDIPHLLNCINDVNKQVRLESLSAITKLMEKESAEEFLLKQFKLFNAEERKFILSLLDSCMTETTIVTLCEYLNEANPDITPEEELYYRQIAWFLKNLRHKSIYESFLYMASDKKMYKHQLLICVLIDGLVNNYQYNASAIRTLLSRLSQIKRKEISKHASETLKKFEENISIDY